MSTYIPSKSYNHFLVLLFYVFQTCFSCRAILGINNNHIRCHDNERDAFLQFKHGIHVDNCGLLDSWRYGHDCCQWHGIRCDNHSGHVTGLYLQPNSSSSYLNYDTCLEGTLNVSLLELKHLKYLILRYNNFIGQIPKFIGSLPNLEHLDLSHAGFTGVIPQEIGNLSRLSHLFLNCHDDIYDNSPCDMWVESLRWLSNMRLLKVVDLGGIDLSTTTNNWLSIVNNLPLLRELHLQNCQLSLKLSSSLSYNNSSTTLNYIDLSENNLNDTSVFQWLFNLSGLDNNLLHLDLSYNQMFGNNMKFSRHAMKILDNLCNLQYLSLQSTSLSHHFFDILQSFSTCSNKSLEHLDLSYNQVWGSIPENIGAFSFLTYLDLSKNQLNGTLPESIGQLNLLETLQLFANSLEGTLTSAHLSNISNLRTLHLGDNTGLIVKISANWIPPFQLELLGFRSCKIGPNFPSWILTQKHLKELYMSNASIKDKIPNAFWNSSFLSNMFYLNMSHNMIYGTLPNIPTTFLEVGVIDLSFNNLEGILPLFLRYTSALLINNNKFSEGLVPFLCSEHKSPLLSYVYLSNNLFSDELPDCWEYFDQLLALHLDNNNLRGNLPNSIGALDKLIALHLSNNKFTGELPISLLNCSSLINLALDNNLLTGYIPANFGHSFKNLTTLSLRNNKFSGGLPSTLCHLSRLQLLDISNNEISGTIPKCLYELKGLSNTNSPSLEENFIFQRGYYVSEIIFVMWKKEEQSFSITNSLKLLKGIDLSDNKLEGEIPEGITSLVGLKFLNLSRNNLSGAIISRIGQLTYLESLDLSRNYLSGEIPTSLSQISSLGVLDFSYNNLSGNIPKGTQLQSFDTSAYMGNPLLCGAPLQKCVADEASTIPRIVDDEDNNSDDIYLGLYISATFGFIIGFWGICGTLVLNRSWRHTFFRFYENAKRRFT